MNFFYFIFNYFINALKTLRRGKRDWGGGGYTTDTNQYTNACVVLPNMERDAGQSDILDKVLKCEISINKAVHREKDVVIL